MHTIESRSDGAQLTRLAQAAADGELRLTVERVLPLAGAADALAAVEAGHLRGKVVLDVDKGHATR